MSPSASSISFAVSTLKPCCEKYSRMEKQIDSSSSTTSKFWAPGLSTTCCPVLSLPCRKFRRRPDILFRLCIEILGPSEFQNRTQAFDQLHVEWKLVAC